VTSLEYMMVTGVYVAGFLALCYGIIRAIHYAMAINAHVMALPVG